MRGIPYDLSAVSVQQHDPRAALRAGIGLRMETSVGRILVFPAAVFTQCEARHTGARPVIGDAAYDRQSWTTMGAVRERVMEAAIRRIHEFAQTIRAGRGIGHDPCADLGRVAVCDMKAIVRNDPVERRLHDLVDAGQRWTVVPQALDKAVQHAR